MNRRNAILGAALALASAVLAAFAGEGAYIAPMTQVSWDQRHPWNFYLPVLGGEAHEGGYVGCVGTMFAQLLTVHRWPARFEESLERTVKLGYDSPITGLPRERLRFNGEVPMPWEAVFGNGTSQLQKHAMARVNLWADLVANMKFLSSGADSTIGYCMNPNQTPYFAVDRVVSVDAATPEELAEMIYTSLAAGCPVGAEIVYENTMGHAVVIDGWDGTQAGQTPTFHVNYGWSGSRDGWYPVGSTTLRLRSLALGFRPRPRAQLDPLPTQSPAQTVRLQWAFPDYWAQRGLAGWRLRECSTAGQAVQTVEDPFSALVDARVATDSQNGQKAIFSVGRIEDNSLDATNGDPQANYLIATTVQDVHPKTYEWPQLFVPTAEATLAFRLQVCYAKNTRLAVEIRAGNSPWQVLYVADEQPEGNGPEQAVEVPLGAYAGQVCQVRLWVQRLYTGGEESIFDDQKAYRLRAWQLRAVTPLADTREVALDDAEARAWQPESLAEGVAYGWRVAPLFEAESQAPEWSAPVATGVNREAAEPVDFLSVGDPAGRALVEGIYRATTTSGQTTFRVKLTPGGRLLKPICQNLSLLEEADFTLSELGEDTFDLSFSLAEKSEKAVQAYTTNALLLTLRATDETGNFAAKEVMVQFTEAASGGEEGTISEPSLGGDERAREATDRLSADGQRLERFAPGLQYDEAAGAWSGWVDCSSQNAEDAVYEWGLSAANALAWWAANYRTQGGQLTPPNPEATYLGEGATSARGYDSPVADAVVASWTAGPYKPELAFAWLLDGTYTPLDGWATPSGTLSLPDGLLRNALSTQAIADLQVYHGETRSSWTELGADAAGVKRAFSQYLIENLAHGPVLAATADSSLVIWGVEASLQAEEGESRWAVEKIYLTRPESAGASLEAFPLSGMAYDKSPLLGTEADPILIWRAMPIYAYGHAKGQASSADPEPTPEPEPEPGEGTCFEPPEDLVIPDEDLSARYGYPITRSFWKARRLAIEQGKALFVLSGADWCSWCSRVKGYLQGVENFAQDFVVYYASRESSTLCPYFHGSLPQFGTFDPRLANPFAGTLQADGSHTWANAWVSPDNGAYDSQRGYAEARIDDCIRKARTAWQPACVRDPVFTLTGRDAVVVGEPAPYALRATFPFDGVEMTLDHRVRWEVLDGPGLFTEAGLLKATAAGEIRLRATSLDDFPGTAIEKRVRAVLPEQITAITLPEAVLNLEDSPTPTLTCLATLDDGSQVPVRPDTWSVEIVENSFTVLSNFERGEDLLPELSAEGVLSYRRRSDFGTGDLSSNICDHRIRVRATRGEASAECTYTVHGPTQVRPLDLQLLTSQRIAPGSVVRLKLSRLAYTYAGQIAESADTKMATYWTHLSSGAYAYTDDWQVAIPVNTTDSGPYTANVSARKAGGAYTAYTATPALAVTLLLQAPGERLAETYAGITTGYLGAYFPERTPDEALACEDTDGDGYANWQEFLLGTEPDQTDDAFAFTSQHFEAKVADDPINLYYKVMFTVRPERNYRIEAKEAWDDPWEEVGSFDAETRTLPTIANAPLADRAKFFRVSIGFTERSGGTAYSTQRFTPAGLAIAPGALLDLTQAYPLTLEALAMDDYAPGIARIRLPEGLPEGTPVLSAPKRCQRWMAYFAPEAPERYAFTLREEGTRLVLYTAPAANPQPKPPADDTGAYRDDVKSHLSAIAREHGFTQDFSLNLQWGNTPKREPKAEEVNDLLRCFDNLVLQPDPEANALTLHATFSVESLAFVTLDQTPYLLLGARVESTPPDGTQPDTPVDFAQDAHLALHARDALGNPSGELSQAQEVSDATGATPGRCPTPGLRYYRIPLEAAPAARFFHFRISRPD